MTTDIEKQIKIYKEAASIMGGLLPEELESKKRKREIAQLRFMCWYNLKKEFGKQITLKIIGQHFGGKHYSTIIHGINATKDALKIYPADRRKNTLLLAYVEELLNPQPQTES